jgi:hypothetical protein
MRVDGGTVRLAWAGTSNVEGVFFLNDSQLATGQHPGFMTGCGCELGHVIPDPLRPVGYIGLCIVDGVRRNLVRFDDTSCETIVTGDQIGDRRRMSYLAVAE